MDYGIEVTGLTKNYDSFVAVKDFSFAVKRGEGTFVAETLAPLKRAERREALSTAATRYVSVALTMGSSPVETVAEVEAALERMNGGRRKS